MCCAASPLTVLLEKGSSSFLDIAVGDESSFVNTTRISASDVRQLSNGDLKAQVDPNAGLHFSNSGCDYTPVQLPICWHFLMLHNAGLATITYLTHVAVLHSTATILGGRHAPFQLEPYFTNCRRSCSSQGCGMCRFV